MRTEIEHRPDWDIFDERVIHADIIIILYPFDR